MWFYITICYMRQKGKVSITFVTGYKICDTVTFPERPSQRLVLSPQFSARHSLTLMLKIESLTHVVPVFSFPCMIVQRVCLLQKHDIDVHLHQIWAFHSYISHMTMNDSFQRLKLIRYFLDAFWSFLFGLWDCGMGSWLIVFFLWVGCFCWLVGWY